MILFVIDRHPACVRMTADIMVVMLITMIAAAACEIQIGVSVVI